MTPDGRQGFGTALLMLAGNPPAKHPWLTVEVVEQEAAIDEYQADSVAVFIDSLACSQNVNGAPV